MNVNSFSFRKHTRNVEIEGETYTLDCSEKTGAVIDRCAAEAKKLAADARNGTGTTADVKTVYETMFRAALGDEQTDALLDKFGASMDVYDYDDLARFLIGEFNAHHQDRIHGVK